MSVDPYPEANAFLQPFDATLEALADLTTSADTVPYFTGVDQAALMTVTPFARSLLDDGDAVAMQTTLGLGTMSVQNANAVAITGGTAVNLAYVRVVPTGSPVYGYYSTLNGPDGSYAFRGDGTAPSYFGGPLQFADPAPTRTNLGLGSGATITASGTAGRVALWSAATTLTSTVNIQINEGSFKVGLNSYAPPVNVGFRAYTTSLDTLRLGGGDTAARWPLDCPGQGHILQLGVYYGPDTAATDGVDLRVYRARIDNLGVGYSPNLSYSIRAGNSWFDAAGFGYAGGSGYSLRAGSTYVDAFTAASVMSNGTITSSGELCSFATLRVDGNTSLRSLVGVAGWADSRWHFTNWGTSYFANTVQIAHYLGCYPYAPVSGYGIRCGEAYIDHMGVGTTPYGGWDLTVNSFLAWTNIQANGTLYIGSTSQFGGGMRTSYIGSMGDADSRFGIRVYFNMYCDGIPYSANPGPWNAYSDRRLKHNIQPILHPLETMTRLRGVLFEYNDTDMGKPAGLRMGVLAQEVEAVLPGWVGELDGYKTTQLSQFEALTIESFKALLARLEYLEAQLSIRKAA